MLISGVDNLRPPITGQSQPHQPLHAVRFERRLHPRAVAIQNPDRLSRQLTDRDGAVLGQNPGLSREAMVEVSRRRHLERRRLLVVKWTEPFQAAATRALELQVLADDLVDLAALADQRDVGGPD